MPDPAPNISTATKGASSTWMRPISAGVTSQYAPFLSRVSTEENRQTSSLRPMGEPW